jgi:hypothetical protein
MFLHFSDLKRYITRHGGSCLYSQLLKWQRSGGQQFKANPGKNISKIPSQPISQVWWHAAVIPSIPDAVGRRIVV